jgi:cytidylate kinase
MLNGIIIMGLNGSGKSTICHELADLLNYKRMDVEDYYFLNSDIPYANSRTHEEVKKLLLNDIKMYRNYVLSSVGCNWGSEIVSTYKLAIMLYAPLQVRLERIKQREITRFGSRVLEGGDMYESQKRFHDMVVSRSEEDIKQQISTLTCPVLEINATLPVKEILGLIYSFVKLEFCLTNGELAEAFEA